MTPFELKVQNELDVEWQRFTNKWLFPWHQMKVPGKSFTVEDFRGGTISYGGIMFEDQQQAIFWQAIERYVKGRVHEVFGRWDVETKEYPAAMRASSLDGTTVLLGRFAAVISRQAAQTEQALRESGSLRKDASAHSYFAGHICSTEIANLSNAHKALLPALAADDPAPKGWRKVLGAVNARPGMFGINVDLKKLFGLEK